MPPPSPMAITYVAKEYDTQREHLMGRHSASESLLKAWSEDQDNTSLFSYSPRKSDHQHFQNKVSVWTGGAKECVPIHRPMEMVKNRVSALYTPDPNLAKGSWQRTSVGASHYSLLGVTHTICSDGAMDLIGELTTSPTRPWDALICTSHSVKGVVEKLLARKLEDLRDRFGLKKIPKPSLPQLPIIPLGVDISRFPAPEQTEEPRKAWREKLGLPSDAVVALFVGRLSFHAKAHPYPMFEALERCSSQSEAPLALILCGWYANDATRDSFLEAAKLLCPSVRLVIVDGRDPDTQRTIWSSADIFISLSDNIQETFGLTPLEAMANGLPVLVSDWNGYKETVRHGIEGFRARTLAPPPGHGEILARLLDEGQINYDAYLMESCQQVVVDVDEVTRQLQQLIDHPQLRQEMGAHGRKKVLEEYSWPKIVTRYQDLLGELKERRSRAQPTEEHPQPHPLRPDPFDLHSHYPTDTLCGNTLLLPGFNSTPLQDSLSLKVCRPVIALDGQLLSGILKKVLSGSPASLSTIEKEFSSQSKVLVRHILYLAKYGYLRLESPQ